MTDTAQPLAFVIEDDPDAAFIMTEALKQAGYLVEKINNGQDAIERLNRASPQMITLDIHLPDVAGSEIMAHIKKQAHLQETIVIVISADNQMADNLTEAADLVLLKPISFTDLTNIAKRIRK